MPRITRRPLVAAVVATAVLLPASPAAAKVHPVLVGSHESMVRQNRVAHDLDFAFARTRAEVLYLIRRGAIVPVHEDDHLRMRGVSYAYTRPSVRMFLHHLSTDYASACGRPLVVTSLTRPVDEQPWNASPLSVHPAGMAVDLHRPSSRRCRRWLEARLLRLEADGVLDVTREHDPPHYHVAVFPEAYRNYTLARRIAADSLLVWPTLANLDTASLPPVQPTVSRASAGPTSTAAGLMTGVLGGLLILAADSLRRRRTGARSGAGSSGRRGMQEPPPSDESERRGS